MHTVVVHLNQKLYDWYLIEPLFYKVQSNKRLTEIEAPLLTNQSLPDFKKLEQWIDNFLYEKGIQEWQVVFLFNADPSKGTKVRLNRYLYYIREKVLRPLEQKMLGPDHCVFLLMDALKRNLDASPNGDFEDVNWQLDTKGYITSESVSINHNMFTEHEINQLNDAWGDKVDLSKAGVILQKPKKVFLEELSSRREEVLNELHRLIEPKYELAKKYKDLTSESVYQIIPERVIEGIKEEFTTSITQKTTGALSENLAYFKPSELLKRILSKNIAISALIDDFSFIRVPYNIHSNYHRTVSLVQVCSFINAITYDTDLTHQLSKGKPYELECTIDKKVLDETLHTYITCLELVGEKLESELLDSLISRVHPFNEIQYDSIQLERLENVNAKFSKVIPNKPKNVKKEWDDFFLIVEEDLKMGEKTILDSLKREATSLMVSKRKDVAEFDNGQGEKEIASYQVELEEKLTSIQTEVANLVTQHDNLIDRWKTIAHKQKKELEQHLNLFPSRNMVLLMFAVSWAILLIPYYQTIHNQSFDAVSLQSLFVFFMIPGLVISSSLAAGLLIRRQLLRPIKTLTKEMREETESFGIQLQELPKSYEAFLKKIYNLFQTRQQLNELTLVTQELYRKNLLIHYHQNQVDSHKTRATKLQRHLNCRLGNIVEDDCRQFVTKGFSIKNSVKDNMVYSINDCCLKQKDTDLSVKIIGASFQSNQPDLPYLIDLKLSNDKVYLL